MQFMGVKAYKFPLVKFYWPFFVGFGVSAWLVSKAQSALMNTEEFINDPRHPRFAAGETEKK
ncbi:F1F0 ATP synthase subunit I [Martiniozyma asiatica (nom. inval.)]|nr:F1F0 ATP synthase subunit I [Martiniozyma asiatica]